MRVGVLRFGMVLGLALAGGVGGEAMAVVLLPAHLTTFGTFQGGPWTQHGIDNFGSVDHGVFSGFAVEERAEMGFDLLPLAGMTDVVATLRPYDQQLTSPTVPDNPIRIDVYGFTGTGTKSLDAAVNLVPPAVGSFFSKTAYVGFYEANVSAFVRAQLAAGSRYAGFVLATEFTNGTITVNMQSELVVTPRVAADFNADGAVDRADLNVLLGKLGQAGGATAGDLNGNGVVSADDLALFNQYVAGVTGTTGSVPEAGVMGGVGVVVLGVMRGRRRARH